MMVEQLGKCGRMGVALWLMPVALSAGIFSISDEVEEVYQFNLAPSAIVAAPGGGWIVAADQREKPQLRCVWVPKSGEMTPFPTPGKKESPAEADALALDAIQAVKVDASGVAWLLDNGRRSELSPKLIGWDLNKGRLLRIFNLVAPAVSPGSYCTGLVVDPAGGFAYVSDPANGKDAGLIVINLQTGLVRRVLSGDVTVQPEINLPLNEHLSLGLETRRIDGTQSIPHSGIDSMTMDRKGEWLYYAPLLSSRVYRIPGAMLRDSSVHPGLLAGAIEAYAAKPLSRGMIMDAKNNLYVGDIGGRSIGMIDAKERRYRALVTDARLLWPEGLTFGHDGRLHFFSPTRMGQTGWQEQDTRCLR
jgi:sugar lactone lactonase YvrE